VDRLVECCPQDFSSEVTRLAVRLAHSSGMQERIAAKKQTRERDESVKPLSLYREAELSSMLRTFSDPHAPYHALRRAFVRKQPSTEAPSHLIRAGAAGR
jgi:putative two-component system hydrogenase maturation factor HypX/HoxX